MSWPDNWIARLDGSECSLCAEGRPENPARGPRIYAGARCDAYLARSGTQPGWATVIWRGGHVTEPTDLSEDDSVEFWREVLTVGRAMQTHFQAFKMNYSILGNRTPHLHAIIAVRFEDDVAAGEPIPASEKSVFPRADVARDAEALKRLLSSPD
ncbi:MAG: HIT domain-containing protein [Phenylobacterium sp.]|uniref:HIT family protein n=1 Tax=Phenylobacterium sp. TaxID=1871053 RepID=UPI00272871BC|nr:HIT domain-containing protein [Phenylobacterium sp.]MDO8411076.1 HIT domain-containing protein [Phenylobacterium sp.]